MNPSVDDRLASVVRAVTDVLVPALPPEAGLALEQAQLVVGHLQIIRAQLDATPAFEKEELADSRALGAALSSKGEGGAKTSAALKSLREAVEHDGSGEHCRQTRVRINQAIDLVIRGAAVDGSAAFSDHLAKTVVEMEAVRSMKDRKWFAAMGFDAGGVT
jgi:hypothetical protein